MQLSAMWSTVSELLSNSQPVQPRISNLPGPTLQLTM